MIVKSCDKLKNNDTYVATIVAQDGPYSISSTKVTTRVVAYLKLLLSIDNVENGNIS